MALSVSGFPEPSRQLVASNEVFTGDNGQDGSSKTTLMNSPRLRGLFGASSTPNKKPDSKHLSTTSRPEETEILQGATIPSTPPTSTASLSFASSFEPLSQQEYELELQLPMSTPFDPPRTHSAKRPQLPPLPRKTTASPVRLGPSLTRLDIGAFSRSPPTLHPHSKPPPPSVVVEEWGPKGTDALAASSSMQQTRPLPSVPGVAEDSGQHPLDNVVGPSVITGPPAPVAGSSKHMNAAASSSKHVNAVAGSSKHSNAIDGSSKHPSALIKPSKPPTSSTIPPSKVIIRQPIPQRTHKPSSPSLSMRYQPLIADPTASSSSEPSADNTLSSPVRPLPRIPPVSPINTSLLTTPNVPSRHTPPAAKIKRPMTSPGIIAGFPVGPPSNTVSRSPFNNITTSWPSRPGDASAQRASSPPLPISSPLKAPRSRTHSRPRRDRSLDSFYSTSRTTPSGIVPPITTNVHTARTPRSLPSPTVGGARPLLKNATLDHLSSTSKALHIQTTIPTTFAEKNGTGRILSPGGGKRSQPPCPPTGPVRPRPKASSMSTPSGTAPPLISVIVPVQPRPMRIAKVSAAAVAVTKMEAEIEMDERRSIDAPLHSHPMDAFADSDSLLHPPTSPSTAESPIEVFMDDQDFSTMSRSPSPMRYARPDSRGNLSEDLEELDFATSSSTSSSPNASPTRRRRTQLRSYRNSYRPHTRTSPPHIPLRQRSPSPIQEAPQAEKDKKDKKKKTTRSYFGDYRSSGGVASLGSGSAPATRASSPERKSRSRQPRKLTDAVSLALEEVRNRGRVSSTSPKRKQKSVGPTGAPLVSSPPPIDDMEVLDISRPIASRRSTTGTTDTTASSSISDHVPGSSSARSSAKVGWGKATGHTGSKNTSTSHLSSAGPTALETDGTEPPYMWVSATKPPIPSMPFIPVPPLPMQHHHHRPIDSPGLEDYSPLNSKYQPDGEADKYGMLYGQPNGGKWRGPELNVVTSTVSVSRPSSSTVSSPFSAFSVSNRSSTKSRAKHMTSASMAASGTVADDPVLIIQPELQGFDNGSRENKEAADQVAKSAAVSARRIMRTVDSGGDVWEHEQETGVADVIPHLRHLKAKR